jgi:hypothetical protein
MATPLLSKNVLNTMRRALYGRTAVLRLYRLPTGAEPELLATITDGWYVQRQAYTKGNESEPKQSLLHLAKLAVAEAELHEASRAEIDANGETFTFNFSDVAPMQQLGSGYIVPLLQVSATTD